MHGLAAALTVTLNVLLAASLATGARAPQPPPHPHSRAGKLLSLRRERFAKNKNSSVLEKANTLQEHKTCDHNRMAHLDTMQF